MSDANRVTIRSERESVFGTTVGTSGQVMRYTAESLKAVTGTTQSQEIRSDRQVSDIVRVGFSTAGDINIELSPASHEEWLEDLLQTDAAFSTGSAVSASDISAAASDQSFNSAGAGFSSGWAGRIIKVSGFTGTNTTANGIWRVLTATASKLVVQGYRALIDDAAGESVTVSAGTYIRNGKTTHSYSLEKEYTDIATMFEILKGQMIDRGRFEIGAGEILKATFSWMGKSCATAAATAFASSVAATTAAVGNAIDNVTAIMLGYATTPGGSLDADAQQVTLDIGNNLRTREQIGDLGPVSIGSGTFDVNFTLRAYFVNSTELTKYLNFTASGMMIIVTFASGAVYVFDMPYVKYTDGGRTVQGINTDVMAELEGRAIMHPTYGFTMSITKF